MVLMPGFETGPHWWEASALTTAVFCSSIPSSHEPPHQCNQAPVTLINSGKIKWGRGGGKCAIQRLNEVNEPQKIKVVLL